MSKQPRGPLVAIANVVGLFWKLAKRALDPKPGEVSDALDRDAALTIRIMKAYLREPTMQQHPDDQDGTIKILLGRAMANVAGAEGMDIKDFWFSFLQENSNLVGGNFLRTRIGAELLKLTNPQLEYYEAVALYRRHAGGIQSFSE